MSSSQKEIEEPEEIITIIGCDEIKCLNCNHITDEDCDSCFQCGSRNIAKHYWVKINKSSARKIKWW